MFIHLKNCEKIQWKKLIFFVIEYFLRFVHLVWKEMIHWLNISFVPEKERIVIGSWNIGNRSMTGTSLRRSAISVRKPTSTGCTQAPEESGLLSTIYPWLFDSFYTVCIIRISTVYTYVYRAYHTERILYRCIIDPEFKTFFKSIKFNLKSKV